MLRPLFIPLALLLATTCVAQRDVIALRQARQLEKQGEGLHDLSDIGEAERLWSEALEIRKRAFGDSSAEAAVGYAYQARYHNYMAAPQLEHRVIARREAERAKRLLKLTKDPLDIRERILILREYAYAYKVSEMDGPLEDHTRLARTRTFFREALAVAKHTHDTIWIAQITHDIGNTFTDEVGRYNQELPRPHLQTLVDSGLWHYRRSLALMTAAGMGASESVMMDHLTTALLYRSAYDSDSTAQAVASYDRALLTMLQITGRGPDVDVLTYEPRIANKAQMIELLYLRSLSFADPDEEHKDPRLVKQALHSLEAAVPYWEAMLREYKSRDLHKVIGSYSHFPFRYGTYLAAELFVLAGDSSRLRQAIAWSDRNRAGMEQRDLLRAGGRSRASDAHERGPLSAPTGTMVIAFHEHPRLLAFANTVNATRLFGPTTWTAAPWEIHAWGRQLREAMHANDVRAYQRIGFALYQNTIGPVLLNETAHEIIIVPGERMGMIPFEALVTDTALATRWGDLHYVQARWQVRYARTISEALGDATELIDEPVRFMVAEPSGRSPLPFAMQLAHEQRGQHEGEVTRATITKAMRSSAPLHIATHAEVPTEPDALPYLLLDDGPLTIASLDTAHCSSLLVVLSTCSSGDGRVYIGEGTLSLAHSFLRSGAKAVVQTLWPVDDQATSEVLELMYEGMEDGLSVSDALAEAKRAFVQAHADDALSNPFYWSGIVVTGSEVRPPQRMRWIPQGRNWFWWTSGAALLLAAVSYRSLRRSKRSRALAAS